MKKENTSSRLLARSLAREISKQDLSLAQGGQRPETSSTSWSSSGSGEGDDGGADD